MSVKLRKKPLKDGRESLYLDIYKDGKRRYEFLKLYLTGVKQSDKKTMAAAKNIRSKREMGIMFSSQGYTPPDRQNADFLKYFERTAADLEPGTQKQYRNVLKKLKEYGGATVLFKEVDRRWAQGFKRYLLTQLTPNTARIYFAMFKAALNRAVQDEIIPDNPAQHVTGIKKTNGKKIPYLSIEELKVLAAAECPHPEVKQAFIFCCYTGLRYSDVETLTWDDIIGNQIEFNQTKTREAGYIPINRQVHSILEGRKREGLVFDLPTNAYSNMILKTWAENAGLKKWIRKIDPDTNEVIQAGLTYHVSRHTFAVMSLNSGTDIYTLKELLGHQSLESTEVYANVVNKTKEDAINNLPEL